MKAAMSVMTIVDPTGVFAASEKRTPINVHTIEVIAAQIVTLLKVLKILIAESVGKVISAEMSNAPTMFMETTMITPVMIAISVL